MSKAWPGRAALQCWFWRGRGPLVEGDLDLGPEVFDAFVADSRRTAGRRLRLLTFTLLLFNVVFWATDDWLLGGVPGIQPALSEGRATISLVGLFVLAATALPRRLDVVLGWLAGGSCCAVLAWTLSRLGGPSAWFHQTYPFLFLPLVAWISPFHRVAYTGFLAAVLAGTYFGLHPEHLRDPLAASSLGTLCYMMALATLLGLGVDHLRARVYLLRQAQQRNVLALGAQVEVQTRHIQRLLDATESGREADRKALASELHDELGQLLTAMRCVLKAAQNRIGAEGAASDAGKTELALLAELQVQATSSLRSVLARLRPQVLEDLGLAPAVAWLAERICGVGGLVHTLELPADGALEEVPEAAATAAFRVLQEALTNVLRHASAGHVQVVLASADNGVALSVTDDGCGISPEAEGLGILGMRERARALGGRLDLSAGPQGGTRVQLWLPIEVAA